MSEYILYCDESVGKGKNMGIFSVVVLSAVKI